MLLYITNVQSSIRGYVYINFTLECVFKDTRYQDIRQKEKCDIFPSLIKKDLFLEHVGNVMNKKITI